MSVVDDRGRLFGRLNLFDAAIVAFVVVLLPIAYGTFLLFRTPAPRITSVARAELTREELRLRAGGRLTAKLKVHGSGFRPLLRASIDDSPAMGFVFENPNSADVLLAEVAPGTHDLVLYDGVQEVARAKGAVAIQPIPSARLRLAGTLIDLDRSTADALHVGSKYPAAGEAQTEVVALGPIRPGRHRLSVGPRSIDLPVEGRWERDAVAVVRCDPDATSQDCAVGGKTLEASAALIVTVAGPSAPLSFSVDEVLPDTPPRDATAKVRLVGSVELLDLVRTGDRDLFLDPRAAVVTAVGARRAENGAMAIDVTLRLGVDESRDGWRYRGRLAKAGAPFTFTTDRYALNGSVLSLTTGEK